MKQIKQDGIPEYEYVEIFPKKSKYCICIPIINEGTRIIDQLKKGNDAGINTKYDILICDGDSSDGSTDIDQLKNLNVNTLLIKKSTGKQGTQLRMGFWYALQRGYEGILTIDGNNKDLLAEVPRFVEKLDLGYDYVQGSRFIKGGVHKNTPLVRFLAIRLIHSPLISIISGNLNTDSPNNFRGYSSKYLRDNRLGIFRDVFDSYELIGYLSVMATKLGFRFCEVPVTRVYPYKDKVPTKIKGFKSNLNLLKILWNLLFNKYNL